MFVAQVTGFKETMLHSREALTLSDVKSNLRMKSDIDNDLTSSESKSQDVGLFVERGRGKERNPREHVRNQSTRICFAITARSRTEGKFKRSGEANVAESNTDDVLYAADGGTSGHWIIGLSHSGRPLLKAFVWIWRQLQCWLNFEIWNNGCRCIRG